MRGPSVQLERVAKPGCAGNPYDNAHVERFMKTAKHEEIYLRSDRTMTDPMTQLPA